jgi:hypothetical protein
MNCLRFWQDQDKLETVREIENILDPLLNKLDYHIETFEFEKPARRFRIISQYGSKENYQKTS